MSRHMDAFYFDSSAFVKNYIFEDGSAWVNDILNRPDVLFYTIVLTKVEVICAFNRRLLPQLAHDLSHNFLVDLENKFQVLELNSKIVDLAMQLGAKYKLRGYDAIQLASAKLIAQNILAFTPLTFVCADEHLCKSARQAGLNTENPNHHGAELSSSSIA